MRRAVPLAPDREKRKPRLSVVRVRRPAGQSDEIQMEPLPGPSSEIQMEPLPGQSNETRNAPSPGPSSKFSMRTTVSLVPDREKREPRLSVVRLRRPVVRSDEIEMEPLPGPSNANQIEPLPGPSNENQTQQNNQTNNAVQGRHKNAQKSSFKIILKNLRDFCTNTTVHGFRYFTEPKRHWVERVWWAITVIASISLCGFMIHNMWVKWHEHPTIVSFDDILTPIDQIPFPAVTICPTKKFLKQKVNITKIGATLNGASTAKESVFTDLTPKELSQLNAILQTCSVPHRLPADLDNPPNLAIYETIRDITLDKESTITGAVWNLQEYSYAPIFTEDGLCFTFNSLNSHQIYSDGIASELLTVRDNPNATDWNRESGYRSSESGIVYPYRSTTSQMNFNLMTKLESLFDDSDKFCNPFAAGFRLWLHAPDELPQTQNNFIHIPPEQRIFISVTPNVVTTSNGLRSYAPHARDCYFQSEHQLRFFRLYSEQKCQLECLADFTRNECGCVHFSMPRHQNTKVCTMLEMECYRTAKQRYDQQHIVKQCDCLPDCTSISYNAEVSPAPYVHYLYKIGSEDQRKLFNRTGFPMFAIFLASFKEDQFILINRSESSTMWDFLSNCGGLLGLFMGVSVLSIVEMIYFFTLRLWVNWRQQNKVQPIAQAEAQSQAEAETETTDPPISQNIVEDYCSNTTVHGFCYLTEPKRHRVERVWWAVAVIASIVCCGVIIQRIWTNWNENPVIVSFDDELTSIGEIPFPAVTVCPTKKFISRRVDPNMLVRKLVQSVNSGHSTIESMSPEEISQLDALLQTESKFFNFPSNFSIPSSTMIYDAIKNISLEEKSTIQSLKWCNQLDQFKFKPIFTGEGLCYTFNSLNSREIYGDVVEPQVLTVRDNPNSTQWNREDGYQPNGNQIDVYPYRVFGSDAFDALTVRLGLIIDYRSETPFNIPPGFSVSLHAPDELSQMGKSLLFVPSEHDVYISVRPETITTSDGLRNYSPHKRGCYFESERQLHFFRKYSQQKCELECLTIFILKESGCTHFSLPRDNSTRICTMVDMNNYGVAVAKFGVESLVKQCDCLPDCTSIVYHTELSQVPYHYYDDAEVMKIKKSYQYPGYLAHSKLRISFKENRFISVNRSESSTMWDFLSSCGGLLGLFMGVSVLSIVEVVYYFTLRWGVNVWRQQSDRIKAAAARIKRACVAFIRNQWEKLKERKRKCGAFIRNQWEKLEKQIQEMKLREHLQWANLRQRFPWNRRATNGAHENNTTTNVY